MTAEVSPTTVHNIIIHVDDVYVDAELQGEGTCKEFLQVRQEGMRTVRKSVRYYNLDMILSVGDRVNTKRGTQFRIRATLRLREYLMRGYIVHENRMRQLGQMIKLVRRAVDRLDARQVLDVIEHYNNWLSLLDDYDHQCLTRSASRLMISRAAAAGSGCCSSQETMTTRRAPACSTEGRVVPLMPPMQNMGKSPNFSCTAAISCILAQEL